MPRWVKHHPTPVILMYLKVERVFPWVGNVESHAQLVGIKVYLVTNAAASPKEEHYKSTAKQPQLHIV